MAWLTAGFSCLLLLSGCRAGPAEAELNSSLPPLDATRRQLVGDLTRIWGNKSQRVDGVSLVVGLKGTGSDPEPSAERSMLMSEMQTREVDKPNKMLASPSTSLVQVRGLIPPGARQGDRFDLQVLLPKKSETTSLHSGWLMAARLKEYAVINHRMAEGHLLAMGQGDVLTESLLECSEDAMGERRAYVLGGGVVTKARGLGLVIRDEFSSVKTSAKIGEAINSRFSLYSNGSKRGVANPKRDDFVELLVHPMYQDNVIRYLRVVQNIAVRETPRALADRLEQLRQQMSQPATAAMAAVRLEAIGSDAEPVLLDVVNSADPEIAFYAAEALAYLNHPNAVGTLGKSVRQEPAFRRRALTALAAMDDVNAQEELIELLNARSAETRYGAFRLLRSRTPDDPMIRGEFLNESFMLHTVSSTGPALIHVAREERPEIVLFGTEHQLSGAVVLFAGSEIVVRGNGDDNVIVRRLSAGMEDQDIETSRNMTDIIAAIASLEGSYADVVQALVEARRLGALESRVEFSAVPTAGRLYNRKGRASDEESMAQSSTGSSDQAGVRADETMRESEDGDLIDLTPNAPDAADAERSKAAVVSVDEIDELISDLSTAPVVDRPSAGLIEKMPEVDRSLAFDPIPAPVAHVAAVEPPVTRPDTLPHSVVDRLAESRTPSSVVPNNPGIRPESTPAVVVNTQEFQSAIAPSAAAQTLPSTQFAAQQSALPQEADPSIATPTIAPESTPSQIDAVPSDAKAAVAQQSAPAESVESALAQSTPAPSAVDPSAVDPLIATQSVAQDSNPSKTSAEQVVAQPSAPPQTDALATAAAQIVAQQSPSTGTSVTGHHQETEQQVAGQAIADQPKPPQRVAQQEARPVRHQLVTRLPATHFSATRQAMAQQAVDHPTFAHQPPQPSIAHQPAAHHFYAHPSAAHPSAAYTPATYAAVAQHQFTHPSNAQQPVAQQPVAQQAVAYQSQAVHGRPVVPPNRQMAMQVPVRQVSRPISSATNNAMPISQESVLLAGNRQQIGALVRTRQPQSQQPRALGTRKAAPSPAAVLEMPPEPSLAPLVNFNKLVDSARSSSRD